MTYMAVTLHDRNMTVTWFLQVRLPVGLLDSAAPDEVHSILCKELSRLFAYGHEVKRVYQLMPGNGVTPITGQASFACSYHIGVVTILGSRSRGRRASLVVTILGWLPY